MSNKLEFIRVGKLGKLHQQYSIIYDLAIKAAYYKEVTNNIGVREQMDRIEELAKNVQQRLGNEWKSLETRILNEIPQTEKETREREWESMCDMWCHPIHAISCHNSNSSLKRAYTEAIEAGYYQGSPEEMVRNAKKIAKDGYNDKRKYD